MFEYAGTRRVVAGPGSLMVEFSTSSRGLAASLSTVGAPGPVERASESPVLPRSPLYATRPTRPLTVPGSDIGPSGTERSASSGPSVPKPSHTDRCLSGSAFFSYATTSVQPPHAPAAVLPLATLTWATVHSPAPLARTSRVTSAEAWNASAPCATRCPTTLSASSSLYWPPGSAISTRPLSFGGFCSPTRRLPPQYRRAYVTCAPLGSRTSERLEL